MNKGLSMFSEFCSPQIQNSFIFSSIIAILNTLSRIYNSDKYDGPVEDTIERDIIQKNAYIRNLSYSVVNIF